jgi:hypothetical protein
MRYLDDQLVCALRRIRSNVYSVIFAATTIVS